MTPKEIEAMYNCKQGHAVPCYGCTDFCMNYSECWNEEDQEEAIYDCPHCGPFDGGCNSEEQPPWNERSD